MSRRGKCVSSCSLVTEQKKTDWNRDRLLGVGQKVTHIFFQLHAIMNTTLVTGYCCESQFPVRHHHLGRGFWLSAKADHLCTYTDTKGFNSRPCPLHLPEQWSDRTWSVKAIWRKPIQSITFQWSWRKGLGLQCMWPLKTSQSCLLPDRDWQPFETHAVSIEAAATKSWLLVTMGRGWFSYRPTVSVCPINSYM